MYKQRSVKGAYEGIYPSIREICQGEAGAGGYGGARRK
ncbi:hypothetical protein ES705_50898 [subsurface metagenome]